MENALKDIPVSMLDFATIVEGDHSVADAFKRSRSFAQHAERMGFKRYWFAEHHNMESVASAATSVLIGFVAGHTASMRVGAGGIMLPNHAPLVIAEQFGTLEALYPGRIDLGIGRAPGTDPLTSQALRRTLKGDIDHFPNDVKELIGYLGPRDQNAKVRAIPGEGSKVPVWMLGSSTYSAQVAGLLGLPFAFASHFAPTYLHHALETYRSIFRPSEFLQQPYAMACVNVIAGETDEQAQQLATSFYQLALGMFRKDRSPLPRPVRSMDGVWTEIEKQGVLQMMQYSFIGSRETVDHSLRAFVERTNVDELMIATHIHSDQAKMRSMELTRSLFSDPVSVI